MDVPTITRIIMESFCDIARPDDEGLFEVYDPAIPDFLTMIRGKDWKGFLHVLETAEFSMAMYYGGMAVFMTEEALHYFAPALLIFSMNENSDVLPDMLFGILDPSSGRYESDSGSWQKLVGLFTNEQRRAVVMLMTYRCRLDPDYIESHKPVRDVWARLAGLEITKSGSKDLSTWCKSLLDASKSAEA